MSIFKVGSTYPLSFRLDSQYWVVDVNTGRNQLGVIVIPPDKNSYTVWAGDVGVTVLNPAEYVVTDNGVTSTPRYSLTPGTEGSWSTNILLDQEGRWEFRIVLKGLTSDYDLIGTSWVNVEAQTTFEIPGGGAVDNSTFRAVLVPVDFVATCDLTCNGGDFTVDFGDGTPTTFTAGTTASAVPTGNIIVKNVDGQTCNRFQILTNTYSDVDVQRSSTLTNLNSAFFNATNITSFAIADTSLVTDFTDTWRGCSGLTSFPVIDTAASILLSRTWRSCSGLTSFPLINSSTIEDFNETWRDCSGLTSFPLIDTSSGTSMSRTWRGCSSLTSFPLINTASVLNLSSTWILCSNLTSFPAINTSICTNFSSTWNSCSSLTSFPALNVSSGTNFLATWANCSALTSIGNLATESSTLFSSMFFNCTNLVSIGAINTLATSGVSSLMFDGCTSLTSPDAATQLLLANAVGFDFN